MLARMYPKKKRPLPIAGCADDPPPEYYANGVTSPMGHRQTHGATTLSRSQQSRASRLAKDEKKKLENDANAKPNKGLKKFLIGPSKEYTQHGPPMDEFGYDYGDYDGEDDGSDDEPQLLRPRRRFVRSGLTTYEQWISKNAMGRRFKAPTTPQPEQPAAPSPYKTFPPSMPAADYSVTSPPHRNGANGKSAAANGKLGNMSSLSNALQDVIHGRPAVLRSVIDPTAGPQKVKKSFVVERGVDGDYFVASRRVPDGPVRLTKDDSFIADEDVQTAEAGATSHSEFEQYQAAANLTRHSEMDAAYRNEWIAPAARQPATVASVMASGKAGLRRRLSNADRRSSVERSNEGSSAQGTDVAMRRPSTKVKVREPARASHSLLNQMAHKYVDHMRQRSGSRTGDSQPPALPRSRSKEEQPPPPPALPRSRSKEEQPPPPPALPRSRSKEEQPPPLPPPRRDQNAPLRAQAIQVVEASSSSPAAGILTDHLPTTDHGPMTMDELFDPSPPAPPPPPTTKPSRSVFTKGKSSSRVKSSAPKKKDKEEEEVDNALMNSFRNLKDVDALKRSRSLEDDENTKPAPVSVSVPVVEASESEGEYPDFMDDRATVDYGSSCDDEPVTRNSNITDFLGGFRSRNSMNRNSLAGRNSLGLNPHRKDDFVSRAARSLRNSRKAAQETVVVTSELSRKLMEARARVPVDLRGNPPQKRRGFLGRDGKRVRFDMTLYCREFEVIEPEESDDDQEVQRWQQRESEMGDDDDDDEEDDEELSNPSDYEDDLGVPLPGPVIAAAVAEGSQYYSPSPYSTDMRYSVNARMSLGRRDDERVSVVSRKSAGKQKFEILL